MSIRFNIYKLQNILNFTNETVMFGFFAKCSDQMLEMNQLMFIKAHQRQELIAALLHYRRHVLEITEGINDPGTIRWQLLIGLMLAWVFVFLCLFKGVNVLGKVGGYELASEDYLDLTCFCIRLRQLRHLTSNGILYSLR